MSRSLYEISEDLALVEQALVDTSDPDGIASLERYLAELAVERERKLDAYCGLIREIEARSQARAAEADRQLRGRRPWSAGSAPHGRAAGRRVPCPVRPYPAVLDLEGRRARAGPGGAAGRQEGAGRCGAV